MNKLLPPFLTVALHDELEPGETLRWQARPSPWRQMRGTAGTFFFGVAVFVFSVAWTAAAGGAFDAKLSHDEGGGIFFVAWGSLFVGAGILQLLAPLRAGWRARHTAYAVTDRRALILEVLGRRVVRSFPIDGAGGLERVESRDGVGDLIFHRRSGGRGGASREIGFFGVADVKTVQRLMQPARVGETLAAR